MLVPEAMVTCCSALRLITLEGGENGLTATLRGVEGMDMSGERNGSLRTSSESLLEGLRSGKKSGLGGLSGRL